jgi:[ribosomal protein S5]-alanine N-acetyltransferase
MTRPFIEAVLDSRRGDAEGLLGVTIPGEWPGEDVHVLRIWVKDMREDPSGIHAEWRARVLTLRNDPNMIGFVGFHGPPNGDGVVEIGYTILEPHRRRGYATEVVGHLIDFAGERGVRAVRASVSPGNLSSLGVLAKHGFVQTGVQMDEVDGEELVFERSAGPPG